ncbi:hypothetical protein WMF31_00145 [Sorangium sp. So ce1036]|uniref:hypothetical protein n=1 Tax=Sorangium sp. So ce1036 TaxID=3133328 RepID=UPI003F003004
MRTLPPRMASLLLVVLAPLALLGAACSAEDGTTPTCTDNLDPEQGIVKMSDGCHQFPYCIVNGRQSAPEECCKNDEGLVNPECVKGYMPLGSGSSTTSGAGGSGGNGGSVDADGSGGAGGDGQNGGA